MEVWLYISGKMDNWIVEERSHEPGRHEGEFFADKEEIKHRFYKVDEVDVEIARLREALEFYADANNYDWTKRYPTPIYNDKGKKAREALEGEEKEK